MNPRGTSLLFLAACLLCCATLPGQEHAGQYSQADIDRGRRIYGANCAPCHGVDGNQVAAVDLSAGKFRRVFSDEDLGRVIQAGIPGTAMPPHKFDSRELAAVIAYVRSMRVAPSGSVATGDAGRGKALFEGAGGCLGCHRVNGRGAWVGPDLTEVAAWQPPDRLWKALVDPSSLPLRTSVRAVTADGKTIAGLRLNEDTYSVQLIDREGRLVSLLKADLRQYAALESSPMPSYRDKLGRQELADIMGYLATLKGDNRW